MAPSPTPNAPRTLAELADLLKDDEMVKVAVHDATYPRELLVSNKSNGYRDLNAQIDLSTYRRIPWEDNIPFFLVYFYDQGDDKPLPVDPRSALAKVTDEAKAMGWDCMTGAEFEFAETAQSAEAKSFVNLTPLTPGNHGYSLLRTTLNKDYFYDLYKVSSKMGVEIEGHHTETGPGVFETALAYTDAGRMADNALLFKLIAKSMGMKHNVLPSFMAKPWENVGTWASYLSNRQLSGCSGHIHVSLRDKDGRNIFGLSKEETAAGGRKDAKWKDLQYISQEAEWFLAGLLEGLKDGK
ncbi:glutamine synthetase [Trichosporon asahii var. asahii CBS 8904]|uniref:Glutamine synthetase n=1 Tax=Trichosporon asahii var. asahii (strain CBS 8904) TaxID=1220162 RepID=K1VVD6_TRIAC|nr:glutamine synthetase [Trichosporon asahii var. asahii CBS 8904]